MAEVVTLKNISKFYHTASGETEALRDINFSVFENEFVSIVGPSGCGKSTILSIIAGLEKHSGGTVAVPKEKRFGYMLQQDHLFPWLSIRKNVLLGLEIRKEKTKEAEARVDALLEKYGLEHFKNSFPSELSGGMRQRAALIRTLAVDPHLLLLDEPFSALDYQTRLNVADDIHRIIKNEGKTAILITHDIAEAISMSDRVIVLTGRPATVKNIYPISLSSSDSPLARRKAPEFSSYFQLLWEELNSNE